MKFGKRFIAALICMMLIVTSVPAFGEEVSVPTAKEPAVTETPVQLLILPVKIGTHFPAAKSSLPFLPLLPENSYLDMTVEKMYKYGIDIQAATGRDARVTELINCVWERPQNTIFCCKLCKIYLQIG